MQSFDKNQRFVGNLRVSMVSVVVTFCDDSGYGKFDYGYTICTYMKKIVYDYIFLPYSANDRTSEHCTYCITILYAEKGT